MDFNRKTRRCASKTRSEPAPKSDSDSPDSLLSKQRKKNKSKRSVTHQEERSKLKHDQNLKEESRLSVSVLKQTIQKENGRMNFSSAAYAKVFKQQVIRHVKKLEVSKVLAPFGRRITALTWHPTLIATLAVGSKWGDIVVWNHDRPSHDQIVNRFGPGCSIPAIKFDSREQNHLYSCSLDGTVCRRDLKSGLTSVYLNTGGRFLTDWYTSLDVSSVDAVVLAGDNRGNVNLVTKNGELVWSKRLHQAKVHDVAFHTLDSFLFATASVDCYVRVWDLRKISDKSSYLTSVKNEKGVNSACFSPCHGTRLLTTDQHNELKIFSGPLWDLETNILHPHRHFHRLTHFKADWHPLEDIVVVGRYPDPKFPGSDGSEPRSVDFFDASDGKLLCQIEPSNRNGLMSINRFDHIGRVLASTMGQHIVLWELKNEEASSTQREGRVKDLFRSAAETRKKRQAPSPKNDEDDDDDGFKKRKKCSTYSGLSKCKRRK